jgi:hypothetical protein
MKRFTIPAAVLLTALILAGGFFLPTFALQYKDRQTIGELKITDGSGVSYETKSELKTIDRLKLFTNAGMVGLDNGKNMDADKAFQSALTELGKLADMGVVELDRESCRLGKYGVVFLIDSADPSKNMIAWNLFIEDESRFIGVVIDDETGMLLALDYNMNDLAYKKGTTIITPSVFALESTAGPSSEGATVMELIGQALADYYGLTFVSSEPQKTDYYARYTFELSDGQESVLLSVTFTYTGFSVST